MILDRHKADSTHWTYKSVNMRFWSKVNKTKGCWEWIGALYKDGYGQFSIQLGNGKHTMVRAHRLSYEFYYSEIPNGLYVLHSCDNRKCVNPKHLWLGTAKQNTLDMINKNRHRKKKVII